MPRPTDRAMWTTGLGAGSQGERFGEGLETGGLNIERVTGPMGASGIANSPSFPVSECNEKAELAAFQQDVRSVPDGPVAAGHGRLRERLANTVACAGRAADNGQQKKKL